MIKKLKSIIFLFAFLNVMCVSAQTDDSRGNKTLQTKIVENDSLFNNGQPEQALYNLEGLLDQAIKSGDRLSELTILSHKCKYNYFLKVDLKEMLSSGNELKQKAERYDNPLYRAKAHKYLGQVYFFNELYDKATVELQKGLDVLNNTEKQETYIIKEKANLYYALANNYNLKGEVFNGIQALIFASEENDKLLDPEQKRIAKFIDYANLGGAYLKVNLDSAMNYAQRSLALLSEKEKNDNQTFLNYNTLGHVYARRGDYNKAIEYFQQAENIKENKHFINIKNLYINLINIYDILGDQKLKDEYETKLRNLELTISKNKNNSLLKIIKEVEKPAASRLQENEYAPWLWIIVAGVVLLVSFFIYHLFFRKRKTNLAPDSYNQLIELLKSDDPTFLLKFEQQYPGFSDKLYKINTELSQAEIELLAMLKLNLDNKEIAKYKFIQLRTVQNRRYKIRKKLNLSFDTDLYKWVKAI